MKTWSFYSAKSGLFLGRQFSGPGGKSSAKVLAANTPDGYVAIEGRYDKHRHRVNLSTGEVIIDESLAADRNHQRRRDTALAAIAELERRQGRPLREIAIDPGNAAAAQRLKDIEAEIDRLRISMNADG